MKEEEENGYVSGDGQEIFGGGVWGVMGRGGQ